jgi:hypothetical protein
VAENCYNLTRAGHRPAALNDARPNITTLLENQTHGGWRRAGKHSNTELTSIAVTALKAIPEHRSGESNAASIGCSDDKKDHSPLNETARSS